MKKTLTTLLCLLVITVSAQAHPGHHHESGLPDFSAHILLGLEYLAGILMAAAIAIFFCQVFRGKSKKSDPLSETP